MKGSHMSDFVSKGADEKFCSSCGNVIKEKAEICPKCGVRQKSQSEGNRSRTTAALFAIILGGFGAHKFYLGKIGQGIVYLVFFWTAIPALIAVVEFIMLLTMTDEKFNEQYNR